METIVDDLNKLQHAALGAYWPTQQEVQEMAQALVNIRVNQMTYSPASGGIPQLVYGRF